MSTRFRVNLADRMRKLGACLLVSALVAACDSPPVQSAGAGDSQTGAFDAITRPVGGATVHRVRMTQQGDRYAFEPSEIVAQPGDVVRFVMVGSQPESVVFDIEGLGAEQAGFVVAKGLDTGVLLTTPGGTFDANFVDAPAGEYPFRSIPHHASGMRGVVTIQPADP